MQNKYIEKASQQALSEALGFDEARAYHLLLVKKDSEVEKEFSYSKKYRLLKSLFEQGAIGKIKPENQDFFSYILMPPSFLYAKDVDKEIIIYLERIYLENYSDILNAEFSQMILKDEKGLLIFLLKYFMKQNAQLATDEIKLGVLGNQSSKIHMIKIREERKRIGVIDRNIAFEFVSMLNRDSNEFMGYLANNNKGNGGKDYVSIVEKEMGMTY